MAKAKSKKKPVAKKKAKKKAAKWVAPRRAAATARGPRSQALPGMGQVRDSHLDTVCEDIGEGLDKIEKGTSEVNDGKSAALQRLKKRGLSAYRHAGVRVTLVPGGEKIAVKREKEREVNVSVPSGGEDTGAEEAGNGGEGEGGEDTQTEPGA